jgi:flavin prenyltransferase
VGKPYVVAITGASGVQYGIRLVQSVIEAGHEVELIISESGRLVIREETGIAIKSYTELTELERLFGAGMKGSLRAYSPKDFSAPVASGSYPVAGMVIAPCSMGTLGSIASGISQNLVHRAADCALREGRRLVIVPRETPLNAIHLENMLKLSRVGARIVPAMPAFYSGAKDLREMIDFMVGKILDQLDIVHTLYPRWTGLAPKQTEAAETRIS